MSTQQQSLRQSFFLPFPILSLLHPGGRARLLVLTAALGIIAWGVAVWQVGLPYWGAATVALGFVFVPTVLKWQDDLRRYGATVMVLSMLVAMQGFHTVEHGVQMIQYHLLNWPPFRSSGIISAANAEWVHFVWNWTVVGFVVFLVWRGMRGPWAWVLLLWSVAHSVEHTFMMARYVMIQLEMARLGVPAGVSAQGLPGFLGRDGWLAASGVCGRLPGLTTLSRIDIHFWWNAGEIGLLGMAGNGYLGEWLKKAGHER